MVTAGVAAVLNARVTLDLAPTKARLKGYGSGYRCATPSEPTAQPSGADPSLSVQPRRDARAACGTWDGGCAPRAAGAGSVAIPDGALAVGASAWDGGRAVGGFGARKRTERLGDLRDV